MSLQSGLTCPVDAFLSKRHMLFVDMRNATRSSKQDAKKEPWAGNWGDGSSDARSLCPPVCLRRVEGRPCYRDGSGDARWVGSAMRCRCYERWPWDSDESSFCLWVCDSVCPWLVEGRSWNCHDSSVTKWVCPAICRRSYEGWRGSDEHCSCSFTWWVAWLAGLSPLREVLQSDNLSPSEQEWYVEDVCNLVGFGPRQRGARWHLRVWNNWNQEHGPVESIGNTWCHTSPLFLMAEKKDGFCTCEHWNRGNLNHNHMHDHSHVGRSPYSKLKQFNWIARYHHELSSLEWCRLCVRNPCLQNPCPPRLRMSVQRARGVFAFAKHSVWPLAASWSLCYMLFRDPIFTRVFKFLISMTLLRTKGLIQATQMRLSSSYSCDLWLWHCTIHPIKTKMRLLLSFFAGEFHWMSWQLSDRTDVRMDWTWTWDACTWNIRSCPWAWSFDSSRQTFIDHLWIWTQRRNPGCFQMEKHQPRNPLGAKRSGTWRSWDTHLEFVTNGNHEITKDGQGFCMLCFSSIGSACALLGAMVILTTSVRIIIMGTWWWYSKWWRCRVWEVCTMRDRQSHLARSSKFLFCPFWRQDCLRPGWARAGRRAGEGQARAGRGPGEARRDACFRWTKC